MQTRADLDKPIKRKITSGTKEWADYNVNCIKGCFNNCRYCYARVMARRFHRSTDSSWKDMIICEEMLKKKFAKKSGRAMFPSTHDLFDFDPFKRASFKVLGNLLEQKNDVLITTKPRKRVVKEIIERFGDYKEQIQFRFTITSNNDVKLSFWEPNAPNYQERFECLQYAFLKEMKTSVSVEPFLDYNPLTLIKAIDPYVSESIWLGKMNYISKNGLSAYESQFYLDVRRNYETRHLQDIFRAFKNNAKIRFKDSIRNQLAIS